MRERPARPLDYASPPRRERTRITDLSLGDFIILLLLAALLLAVAIVLNKWAAMTANGG